MRISFLFAQQQVRLRSMLGKKASNVTSNLPEARLDHFSAVIRITFFRVPALLGAYLFS